MKKDDYIKWKCPRCYVRYPYSMKVRDGYLTNLWVCRDCYDRRPPGEDPAVPGADFKPIRHPGPSPITDIAVPSSAETEFGDTPTS